MDDLVTQSQGPFGLSSTDGDNGIVLLELPFEATTSFRNGTVHGPEIIVQASKQVDTFIDGLHQPWDMPCDHDQSLATYLQEQSEQLTISVDQLHDRLVQETSVEQDEFARIDQRLQQPFNQIAAHLAQQSSDRIIGGIGGEHSLTPTLVQQACQQHDQIGILQIDAHLDLRDTYMGLKNSHACAMHRCLELDQVDRIVNVGARDYSDEEWELAEVHPKIAAFPAANIHRKQFTGTTWHEQVMDILNQLPQLVYLTFDIDGLDVPFCPSTGTPVPGGLSFEQCIYLIEQLVKSGRKIIAFDLVEVAGTADSTDAIVAAQLLYRIMAYTAVSNGLIEWS